MLLLILLLFVSMPKFCVCTSECSLIIRRTRQKEILSVFHVPFSIRQMWEMTRWQILIRLYSILHYAHLHYHHPHPSLSLAWHVFYCHLFILHPDPHPFKLLCLIRHFLPSFIVLWVKHSFQFQHSSTNFCILPHIEHAYICIEAATHFPKRIKVKWIKVWKFTGMSSSTSRQKTWHLQRYCELEQPTVKIKMKGYYIKYQKAMLKSQVTPKENQFILFLLFVSSPFNSFPVRQPMN